MAKRANRRRGWVPVAIPPVHLLSGCRAGAGEDGEPANRQPDVYKLSFNKSRLRFSSVSSSAAELLIPGVDAMLGIPRRRKRSSSLVQRKVGDGAAVQSWLVETMASLLCLLFLCLGLLDSSDGGDGESDGICGGRAGRILLPLAFSGVAAVVDGASVEDSAWTVTANGRSMELMRLVEHWPLIVEASLMLGVPWRHGRSIWIDEAEKMNRNLEMGKMHSSLRDSYFFLLPGFCL